MSAYSGKREQQQAAREKAESKPRPFRSHSETVHRYLELESRPEHEAIEPPPEHKPVPYRDGLRHGSRHHGAVSEHVEIEGRDVEVTSDDVGVTELHLE